MHVVGHSSGALIAIQMAIDRPTLVQSLMLIEPAACGPFQVTAFAELGERFLGPAMGAFAAGDLQGAFDTFMRGVCGDRSREIIEQTLGRAGYEQAVRESSFFFRDEVPACLQWQFVSTKEPIRQPVLVLEGGDGRKVGLFEPTSDRSIDDAVSSSRSRIDREYESHAAASGSRGVERGCRKFRSATSDGGPGLAAL